MTKEKTTDETEETKPAEEVAVEVPAEEVDSNAHHAKPLFTGDLGGRGFTGSIE